MKEKYIVTFYSTNNDEGGILLPVLVILVMFTILTLYTVEDYHTRKEVLTNTKDFYLAKTLENITWDEIKQAKTVKNQVVTFNIGEVEVVWLEKTQEVELKTSLNNKYKRTTKKDLSKKGEKCMISHPFIIARP